MYNQIFDLHADLFKSMSHPRRLEIIQLLRDQELPVTDIHTMLDLPQANISQHLKVLRDSGVVESRKDGKQIFYKIADHKFIKACDLFREILINKFKNSEIADEFTLDMSEFLPLTRDPVCQMRVSPKTAAFALRHQGKKFFFCAGGCYKVFKENPEKYAKS